MPSPVQFSVALLVILLAGCSGGVSNAAPPTRLEVDSEHWPVRLLELGASTSRLLEKRAANAYMTGIQIQLAQDSSTPTAVSYSFYEPGNRRQLDVTYVDVGTGSLSAQDMEAARRAGVDKIFRDALEANAAPQFSEHPLPQGAAIPAPLAAPLLGLRDAYARAQREGLKRADNVRLSVAQKKQEQPLLMWSFTGPHTREDSQAIHIDARTGAYIDEDRINDLSRAERAAQLEASFQEFKRAAAALRASAAGGSGTSGPGGSPSSGSSSDSGNAQACSNRNGTMRYGNCEVYNGDGYSRVDPETGNEVIH